MSPRSREFFDAARERLAASRTLLQAEFPAEAAAAAYYAMLYAARAALSEQDRNAKTHAGTWTLFAETFVAPGGFNRDLARQAKDTQKLREAADYDAAAVSDHEASDVLLVAGRFLDAVAGMLED